MKAAIVHQAGLTPVYDNYAEPIAAVGENVVHVTASAISQVTKSRASGTHYSSSDQFPFIVGIDGTGRLDDGKRVYFVMPTSPYGAMAAKSVVPAAHCVALPDDLDDFTAAAIANPGMSSWAALTERAQLKSGETVLINGATGTAGRLAVQIAKFLGAGKVIATGRNADVLNELVYLGADVVIPLTDNEKVLENHFKEQFRQGVDVVIDYLWGKSAEILLIAGAKAGPDAMPIRFIQVGSISGMDINLPSAVLRSSAIQLMGSGIGSIPLDRLINVIGELLRATTPAGFKIATCVLPLADIEQAWLKEDSRQRLVINMESVNV